MILAEYTLCKTCFLGISYASEHFSTLLKCVILYTNIYRRNMIQRFTFYSKVAYNNEKIIMCEIATQSPLRQLHVF